MEPTFTGGAEKGEICNARCTTNANVDEGITVDRVGRHEHEATRAEIEVRKAVATIKGRTRHLLR